MFVLMLISLMQLHPAHPRYGAVSVRSLVQGSGTVVVYSDARDMRKVPR